MKTKLKKDKRSDLRKEYENAVLLLRTVTPGTDEYASQLKTVERLHKLVLEEESNKPKVNPDTVINGMVGLAQIGVIVGWERMHTITSKAINFVTKGRLR